MKKYHPQYNWIYSNRPRNQAAKGGFDGHIPSKDAPYDFVAIHAEVKLASRCTKFVHGQSGFIQIVKEAMEDAGTVYESFYLDTTVSKASARDMGAGVARGDNMIKLIEEQMIQRMNQSSTGAETV